MSEEQDESQKTEDPTPKRLREAKEKGQLAQSREVNNFLMLFGVAMIVLMILPYTGEALLSSMAIFIEKSDQMRVGTEGNYVEFIRHAMFEVVKSVALAFAALMVLAALTGIVQNGLVWTTEPMKPKLEKISIIKGFKRLFSLKSFVEFAKGIAKITIVGTVAYLLLIPIMEEVELYITMDMMAIVEMMHGWLVRLLIGVMVIVALIAALDFLYQKFEFIKSMRMSKKEIKDEYKQTEGDPMIKGRIRQLRQERSRQRMMAAVPEADVVITNPTHYAIALVYELNIGTQAAPKCVAKGADEVALRIREVAKENKVEIVENPPLARALFEAVDIDDEIPEEHYKAVAEIIAFVFRQQGIMK